MVQLSPFYGISIAAVNPLPLRCRVENPRFSAFAVSWSFTLAGHVRGQSRKIQAHRVINRHPGTSKGNFIQFY